MFSLYALTFACRITVVHQRFICGNQLQESPFHNIPALAPTMIPKVLMDDGKHTYATDIQLVGYVSENNLSSWTRALT
jgi:hypothetical protein